MLLGGKGRPAHKADNFTAICEPTVWIMWDPQRLTTLWASIACYRDRFTFTFNCLGIFYSRSILPCTARIKHAYIVVIIFVQNICQIWRNFESWNINIHSKTQFQIRNYLPPQIICKVQIILYNVWVLDHFWPPVVPYYATEDTVRIVNRLYCNLQLLISLLHVRSYNHLFHSYTFTQFTNTTL
jgi:hypothetical protein